MPEARPNGIVIIRHGRLVYETYFDGLDARWPQQHWLQPMTIVPHDARTKHDLQSITKSVVALLVGIAIDRGAIKNVDAPALSFFPTYGDLGDPDKRLVTLRHLLTMTSGLSWRYTPYLAMARDVDAAADPYKFVFSQKLAHAPGSAWHYNNGSVELVGGGVQQATGEHLDRYAKKTLFDPLQIADWEWGTMSSGNPGASWGLRLRPRDLAKIGQLVLDRGVWHGTRIVSADWIAEMTRPRIVRKNFEYGYLWWLNRAQIGTHAVDMIVGYGWGGQCLYVIPSLDLVAVVTSGIYNFDGKGDQNLAAETVVYKDVLPAALAP